MVCARAGSKRLKDKNIRRIGSETLTARACRVLYQAGIEEVYCVTDIDRDKLGLPPYVTILDRPDDDGESIPLQETVFNALEDHELSKRFEYVAVVMPNAPFINSPLIKTAISRLRDSNMNIIRSYSHEGEENGLIIAKIDYYWHHDIDVYTGCVATYGFEIHDIADYAKACEILVP
jgi:CMP-N-acetylneuraminic acid synthetase